AGIALTVTHLLSGIAPYIVLLGFFNGWFAAFNLVPLGPLDGRKVLAWNAPVWAAAFIVAAALTVGSFLLFFGYIVV
ncbi:MAG: metalloprotease, partial [Thermoplasmata archaeon]